MATTSSAATSGRGYRRPARCRPQPAVCPSIRRPAAARQPGRRHPLHNDFDNPALSGGDPLAALADQPARPRPAAARRQPAGHWRRRAQPDPLHPPLAQQRRAHRHRSPRTLSRATPAADLIKGLAGNDTLRGEGGSDCSTAGRGNDLLDGGDGIYLARFGGSHRGHRRPGRGHRHPRQPRPTRLPASRVPSAPARRTPSRATAVRTGSRAAAAGMSPPAVPARPLRLRQHQRQPARQCQPRRDR